MKNTICIRTNLRGVPLSIRRFIGISAINILNAGILANDWNACITQARHDHPRWPQNALARVIRDDARKTLATCEKVGLTFEKPYRILFDEPSGFYTLWCILSSCYVPMHTFCRKRGAKHD